VRYVAVAKHEINAVDEGASPNPNRDHLEQQNKPNTVIWNASAFNGTYQIVF
jgi:hypothetical protein